MKVLKIHLARFVKRGFVHQRAFEIRSRSTPLSTAEYNQVFYLLRAGTCSCATIQQVGAQTAWKDWTHAVDCPYEKLSSLEMYPEVCGVLMALFRADDTAADYDPGQSDESMEGDLVA